MTLPSPATKTYLDQATDDPKLARPELATLVDTVNAILTHLGLSTITSTPVTIGTGLENNAGALQARAASTSQTGIAELATDAEAISKTDTARVLTPSNLAALGASDTLAGLIELATNAEALTGTDTGRGVTPSSLKYVLDNTASSGSNRQTFTSSGTWTKPSGYSTTAMALLEAWGAGSGGCNSSGGAGGGAGGGGAYSFRWVQLSSLGATETITIGSGGGVGRPSGAGGNTTIGSLLTAYGGAPAGINGAGGNQGSGGAGGGAAKSGSRSGAGSDGYKNDLGGEGWAGSLSNPITGSTQDGCGAVFGGGGGAGAGGAYGGNSVYGGGGGGNTSSSTSAGVSIYGGNGGYQGVSPSAPGGGGGGGGNATATAGANGQARITVFG